MVKYYNIPIFLPELACPFRCSYCNQATISGQNHIPSESEMIAVIERNLNSFPKGNNHIEIAFFGGNFTGLPTRIQRNALQVAKRYVFNNQVQGIRLSTRPDYVDSEKLLLLKENGVTTIELGAQSLDEEVLLQCGRGHTAADVHQASALIKAEGFRLGLQMMIGLSGDTLSRALQTAHQIIEAGADETRIYPCLVIRGTELEQDFLKGSYIPLSLDEAVAWTAQLVLLFENAEVKIIRLGLHPSEELNNEGLIAGPYHPSFKELVMTKIWKNILLANNEWPVCSELQIEIAPKERNFCIGFEATNKKWLLTRFKNIRFIANDAVSDRNFLLKPILSCSS